MECNSYLEKCSDNDVLFFYSGTMLKLGKFKQLVSSTFCYKNVVTAIEQRFITEESKLYFNENWYTKGTDCEILKIGAKDWQKGKVRIRVSVEFIPDEPEIEETAEITLPESPLDDIRRTINQENS